MNDKFSFIDIDRVVNSIRKGLTDWQRKREDKKYDKLDVGFNKDSRFSVVKFELSLDSWSGIYGSSSCGTFFYIHNSEIFRDAFIRVINMKLATLLGHTADLLDKDNQQARAKKIVEVEAELAELKGRHHV